ncbi:MAG: Holliday junction resolvase RuvX, partial [Candidatus Doudnabacteria bacterium]|nr:Holliday junction resolvase RuvX [Candidatus Doudnabacteria bacterium]
EVLVFVEELKKYLPDLAVKTQDERLSSSMAKKLPGGKKQVDSLAAQIFLQNYLDRNK